MRRALLLLWLWALWLTAPCLRAQGPRLTLAEAIRLTLAQNFDIQVANLRTELAALNRHPGNAGMLPALNLSLSPSANVVSVNQQLATGAEQNIRGALLTNVNSSLALGWRLFDGTQMFVNYKRLGVLLAQNQLQSRLQVEQTLALLIQAYSETLRQQRLYDDLQRSREVSQLRYRLAESRLRLGAGSRIEERQALGDYLADSGGLVRQALSLQVSKLELTRIMGRRPATDFTVEDSLPQLPLPSLEELLRRMQSRNAALQIQQENEQLARLDLQLARAAYYPTLDLNLGYNFAYSRNPVGFVRQGVNNGFLVGGTLNVPLFDGLQQRLRVRSALGNAQIARYLRQQQELELAHALERTWAQYRSALQLQLLERQSYQVARENLELAQQSYRLGKLTGLEIKLIQNDYIQAGSRLATATHEVIRLQTDLRQLSGGLVEASP